MDAVQRHITKNVEPIVEEFYALNSDKPTLSWHPRQLELLEGAKNKAKESGLWNFFLRFRYWRGLDQLGLRLHCGLGRCHWPQKHSAAVRRYRQYGGTRAGGYSGQRALAKASA